MEVEMGNTTIYVPIRVGITEEQLEKLKTTASVSVEDELEKLVRGAVDSILGI